WVGPGTSWWLSHPPSSVLGDVCVVLFTIGLTYSGGERARVPDLSRWIWAQALFTLASRCGLMSACGWERGMCSDVVTKAVSPADPGPALGRQEVRSPEWWARAGWPPSSIFFSCLPDQQTHLPRTPARPPALGLPTRSWKAPGVAP
uniref:Uncharacterized protein n=1 Tax=Pan troglodytes TaxID=9598 RepID=A0A2I3S4C4_PANTR